MKVERDFMEERTRSMSRERRRSMVDLEDPTLSIVRQCGMLGVSRPNPLLWVQGCFWGGIVPEEGDGGSVPCDSLLRI